ncbi:MAG TPA: alpha/beta hydrolase [Terriglobia bacterium]|nr:alpha/beta hydrolase [Terriglobia bacterium]
MKQIDRRGFVKAAGALAAGPALAGLVAPTASGQAQNTGDLRVESNIVFGKGGDIDLLLDVYHPPAGVTPKRMAIIHLFGGGFSSGSKNAGYIVNDARALGRLGYTNVAANYRLQGQALWPAQIHDTKAAIRWVRANATRIGVDPEKIAVAGYSAGGMLSLLAAGTNGVSEFEGNGGNSGVSSNVQAGIGVYPLASARNASSLFPGSLSAEEREKAMQAASPTTYIGKNFAPTIFIHGTGDTTIPMSSSIDFFNKLHDAGVPTSMTLIQGAAHAFDNSAPDAVEVMAHSIDLFLDRLIVNPQPYPSFGAGGGRGRGGDGARGAGGAGRGGPAGAGPRG